jgi:hypothetical protein
MLSLAEHQRAMLDLIKGRGAPPADPYLAQIAGSPELGMLREVAVFWRMLGIESACALLARLLKRRGTFEASVEQFYREEDVSPYAERAGEQFCLWMGSDGDPLLAAVVEFELALKRIRAGDTREFIVDWDRSPETVFVALAGGGELPPAEVCAVYRLHLSHALPGLARCERVVPGGEAG